MSLYTHVVMNVCRETLFTARILLFWRFVGVSEWRKHIISASYTVQVTFGLTYNQRAKGTLECCFGNSLKRLV